MLAQSVCARPPVGAHCSSRGGLCVLQGLWMLRWDWGAVGQGGTPLPAPLPVGTLAPAAGRAQGGTGFPPAAAGSGAGRAWPGPRSARTWPTAPGAAAGGGTQGIPGSPHRIQGDVGSPQGLPAWSPFSQREGKGGSTGAERGAAQWAPLGDTCRPPQPAHPRPHRALSPPVTATRCCKKSLYWRAPSAPARYKSPWGRQGAGPPWPAEPGGTHRPPLCPPVRRAPIPEMSGGFASRLGESPHVCPSVPWPPTAWRGRAGTPGASPKLLPVAPGKVGGSEGSAAPCNK